MHPPHVIIVEEVLPEVRRRLARTLYGESMSQERIASLLGTSQAMVSRYLKEEGSISVTLEVPVDRMYRDMIVAALAGKKGSGLTDLFCSLVNDSMAEGEFDERYRERFGTELGNLCRYTGGPLSSRAMVLDDLTTAVDFLIERPIPRLVPAVKVNLAFALPDAASLTEIASFPGRISDRNGRLMGPLPPEFGVSRHLAGMILQTMGMEPKARASINLRYDDEVRWAMESTGADPVIMKRGPGDMTFEPVKLEGKGYIYLVDPGDFGIEPCLYIFGRSPLEVVHKAVELQKKMDGMM